MTTVSRSPRRAAIPSGLAPAGDDSLGYALTDRGGVTALDTGRPLAGAGDDRSRARRSNEILSGTTSHGGALLAPFGGALRRGGARTSCPPAPARSSRPRSTSTWIPAAGLVIFRNAAALPPAAVLRLDGTPPTLVRVRDAPSTSPRSGAVDACR